MTNEDIINNYQKLIWKMTTKFYGAEKDDLFQAGVTGILKARENYKTDCGTKFSTYATSYIFGEMYLLVSNKKMKYSKDMLSLYKLIEKTRYSLAQKINKIPSNLELAEFLGYSVSEIDYATNIGLEIMSLDNTEEERPYYETIAANDDYVLERLMLEEGLDNLDPLEQEIIRSHYFEDQTQQQIAKKLNLTQVMVSRYEKRGKEKMKDFLTL